MRRRIPVSEQGNTYVGMHLSNEDVHKSSQLSPLKHDSSSDGSRCLAGVHQVCCIFYYSTTKKLFCVKNISLELCWKV